MPHIVVEYSSTLQEQMVATRLLHVLHGVVEASGLFDPQAIKARGIGYADVVLPEGAATFVHVTVAILSGRAEAQREVLADQVFQALITALPETDKASVDIREMDTVTYRK